ncbi:S-adenosyl-L-methionine-dependent methyltransferase [Heliocybe sulcata]|uniref:S-adenosyl-L-methionine-dependent methyltransferase n=1 Tax=Heliocybe sulcata TaxID=5364 RepID=A0A5C3NCL1_9AGAM|nr:S-adenosyl-L-methionine-dependent methyltransferase [Heliocybe sulcata]
MSSVLKQVHDMAKQGFGTGTNELYDRARPSYQSEALAYIRQEVQASSVNIVEIGAGTGIATRALLAHPDWSQSVARLRAVEPSEGMRDVFSKTVKDDRVSIADGTFDTTGVEDGWADLVLVAQAFHWCPDFNVAAAEFARILKPTGIVALIWNLEDRDAAGWVAQLRDRVESHESGAPQFRLMLWRQTFDTPNYQSLFQPHIEKIWERSLPGTLEIVVDRACSKSYTAVLPEDEKKKVVEDVTQIVKTGDGMTWQDKEKGIFNYPHKTYVVIWKKK